MSHRGAEERGGEEPVVVRDRRRIDPTTGAVRTPDPAGGGVATEEAAPPAAASTAAASAAAAGAAAAGAASAGVAAARGAAGPADGDRVAELQARLDERTADLQRITAEYANYRKRVDRDREAAGARAKASVVLDLLGVLDDLERAEAHGDLTGAFRAVGEKVTAALQKAGLSSFGHDGELFDPALHEAVQHNTSPEVSGPTVTAVLRRGYKFGERVLRPAMVAVTDHEPAPAASTAATVATAAATAGAGLVEPEPPGALAHSEGAEGGHSGSNVGNDGSHDGGNGDTAARQ